MPEKLTSEVAAVIDQAADSKKEGQRGQHQYQDAVAEGGLALGTGGCGVLVAHGAALCCCVRREQRQEDRQAYGQSRERPQRPMPSTGQVRSSFPPILQQDVWLRSRPLHNHEKQEQKEPESVHGVPVDRDDVNGRRAEHAARCPERDRQQRGDTS